MEDNAIGSADRMRRRLFDVSGKRVVVTGAASGLGFAMAEAMAESGAVVMLNDVNPETLDQSASVLSQRGLRVSAYRADVSDHAQVRALFQEAVTTLGGVDVAFINAGIGAGKNFRDPAGRLEAFSREDWDKVMRLNLDGAFASLQASAGIMKRQRAGSIVVTASTAGLRAEPMVGYAYLAAKAALINLVRQAALELAPYGVRANAIAPGPFRTNIGGPRPRPPQVEALFTNSIPLRRWGEPEEVKGIALLLASPAASFMTGGVYAVDGGASTLTQIKADELSDS